MLGIAKNIKYNNKVTWETRELPFYKGTLVTILDIHIGYSRISKIFNIVVSDIQANFRFGEELDASFISDFRHNELEQIVFDIEEFELILYPNQINKEVSIVKDYITLLAQCRQANFEEYKILVENWTDLEQATKVGLFLKKWFGILPKYFVNTVGRLNG